MAKRRVAVMNTAFRDGFQSVYGARVFTPDFLPALEAARALAAEGVHATVVNCRFLKPYDRTVFQEMVRSHPVVVTVEEGQVSNGFGAYMTREIDELELELAKSSLVDSLPLLFDTATEAQFFLPIATSLAFGIVFATVITLLLVPSLYMILADLDRWWSDRNEVATEKLVGNSSAGQDPA